MKSFLSRLRGFSEQLKGVYWIGNIFLTWWKTFSYSASQFSALRRLSIDPLKFKKHMYFSKEIIVSAIPSTVAILCWVIKFKCDVLLVSYDASTFISATFRKRLSVSSQRFSVCHYGNKWMHLNQNQFQRVPFKWKIERYRASSTGICIYRWVSSVVLIALSEINGLE